MTDGNKSYDTITVLDGLDGVRAKLGMYLGSTGVPEDGSAPRALMQMAQEAISNSLDEIVAGHGDTVAVKLDGSTMTVMDHGRGVPIGDDCQDLINAFTKTHASGKFDDSAYAALGVAGTHGIGMKAVNAASSKMVVKVRRRADDGSFENAVATFEKGTLVSAERRSRVPDPWLAGTTGTIVSFTPDTGPISDDNPKPVLESDEWDVTELRSRLRSSAVLTAGAHISLAVDDAAEEWCFPQGLTDAMVDSGHELDSIVRSTSTVSVDDYDIKVDVAIAPGNGSMSTFANGVPTRDGGHHLGGLNTGLPAALSEYAGVQLLAGDVMSAIDVMLHVGVPSSIVEFEGQTKEKLGSARARKAVINACKTNVLDTLFAESAKADAIVASAKEKAEDRLTLEKLKQQAEKMKKATATNALQMSSKLKKCSSRQPADCELYITEGDSASNIGRNPKTQAVMPIRGKILNVFERSVADALSNTEVSTIMSTINAGVWKDFDPDKMRYHKVIVCADADPDGAHIMTLLVGMFFKLAPGMIEAGRLYVAQAPLYRATGYKNGVIDVKTFYTEGEMDAARPSLAGYDIARFKGLGEMSPAEAKAALADPATRRLKQVTMGDATVVEATLKMLIGNDIVGRKQFIESTVEF